MLFILLILSTVLKMSNNSMEFINNEFVVGGGGRPNRFNHIASHFVSNQHFPYNRMQFK